MSQTAKVLLLYAHPESQDSVANRVLLKPATQLSNVTVHDLYAHYPDFFIDIPYEQELLRQHDVIVFHVLDPMEIDLSFKKGFEFEDLETKERITADPRSLMMEYQKVFGEFLEQYRSACEGMKVDYRVARTDQTAEEYVRAYLDERRRLSK